MRCSSLFVRNDARAGSPTRRAQECRSRAPGTPPSPRRRDAAVAPAGSRAGRRRLQRDQPQALGGRGALVQVDAGQRRPARRRAPVGSAPRPAQPHRDVAGVAAARDPRPARPPHPAVVAQRAACSPGSGRARWRAPRRARPGRSAPGSPPSRPRGSPDSRRSPRSSSPIAEQRLRSQISVRARPGGVRVRVVEPVLDVGPPAAPHHAREHGRPRARARCGARRGRGRRARSAQRGVAAAAVVDRQLALARLVDEPGRVLAHERRPSGRRTRARQRDVAVVAAAGAHRAHDPVSEKAAERAAVHQRRHGHRRRASRADEQHQPHPLHRRLAALGSHLERPYEAPRDGWVTWATQPRQPASPDPTPHNPRPWPRRRPRSSSPTASPSPIWRSPTRRRIEPPQPPPAARISRTREVRDPAVNRDMYRDVGADYHWTDRLVWGDRQWKAWSERVETHLIELDGATAGYFEIERGDQIRARSPSSASSAGLPRPRTRRPRAHPGPRPGLRDGPAGVAHHLHAGRPERAPELPASADWRCSGQEERPWSGRAAPEILGAHRATPGASAQNRVCNVWMRCSLETRWRP